MPFMTPARRRPSLLIVGCGDIGMRVLRLLVPRWRVLALTSSPQRCKVLRDAGATPLLGNLDEAATLGRLAGLADAVLHLAPPPGDGRGAAVRVPAREHDQGGQGARAGPAARGVTAPQRAAARARLSS